MYNIEKVVELLNVWASKEFSKRESNICVFPECIDNSISSHSISEKRVLKKIAVDNHVYYYSPKMDFQEVGTKKVSVFSGFCNKHDSILFDPIDNYDYVVGNKEQEFLFFYRAYCKSYKSKFALVNSYEKLIDYVKANKLTEINSYFEKITISEEQKEKLLRYFEKKVNDEKITLNNLDEIKDTIEFYRDKKRYDRVKSYIINFSSEYHISAAGCFNIEKDSRGNIISKDIPISLTVFPQGGKTYGIFSVLTKHSSYFNEELLKYKEEYQKVMLSYHIACCSDNFAFSPAIWVNYDDKTKAEFLNLNREKFIPEYIDCQNGLNLFKY